MTKQCTKCKRILSSSEFYKRGKLTDRLSSWCKECKSKYQKEKNAILKREVMTIFGGQCVQMDNGIQCSKNVDDNLDELELCHPNGDGDEHRNLISSGFGGYAFYKALKDQDYDTNGFIVQVMCKAHHRNLDGSGKHGKLNPNYKEGKHNDSVWLREKYIDDMMTSYEIANLCGVSHTLILGRMEKFGHPRRKSGRRLGTSN